MNYSYKKQAKSRRPGRAPEPSVPATDEQYDKSRSEDTSSTVVNGNGSGYMSESEKYCTLSVLLPTIISISLAFAFMCTHTQEKWSQEANI